MIMIMRTILKMILTMILIMMMTMVLALIMMMITTMTNLHKLDDQTGLANWTWAHDGNLALLQRHLSISAGYCRQIVGFCRLTVGYWCICKSLKGPWWNDHQLTFLVASLLWLPTDSCSVIFDIMFNSEAPVFSDVSNGLTSICSKKNSHLSPWPVV